MILIINNKKAIWKHTAGFEACYATAQISFENHAHALYFINHFNGQANFKKAMPNNEKVNFSVYHKKPDGTLFEDKMIKI